MLNTFKKTLFILIAIASFSAPFLTFATVDYNVLAPIEGFVGDNGGVEKVGESTLDGYLNNMFRLGIALCTGLAVLMIVIGGIQYVSSDAWSKKSDGKERIIAAVFGLLIALGSWALLNTIDPRLMSTKLTLEAVQTIDIPTDEMNTNPAAGEHDAGGYVPPVGDIPGGSESEMRDYLAQNQIDVNSEPCKEGQTSGCTNVQGLGGAAKTGLIDLKNASGADLTITGGTEGGHVTHGVGKSIVDLRKNDTLDGYIVSNSSDHTQSSHGVVYKGKDGNTYLDEGDHWHVVFR